MLNKTDLLPTSAQAPTALTSALLQHGLAVSLASQAGTGHFPADRACHWTKGPHPPYHSRTTSRALGICGGVSGRLSGHAWCVAVSQQRPICTLNEARMG